MEEYFVYIIFSISKNRYYIGSCADIPIRIERHNAGATPSTKPGRPWILVYSEKLSSKTEALKREKYIKNQKSRVFIQKLINCSAGYQPDRSHSGGERPD
ncbi:MAG: GIY-YIG nuclease family protein [Bacteroidales bacterium]